MRPISAIVCFSLAGFLASCDQEQPASDIDPKLGAGCFQVHRASLPPGSQYEGIEKLADDRLTIKAMNGVGVVELDCVLKPDGTLYIVNE